PGDPMKKPTKPKGWRPADMAHAMLAKSKFYRWAFSYIGQESGMATIVMDIEGQLTTVKLAQIADKIGADCIMCASPVGESMPVFPDLGQSESADGRPRDPLYQPTILEIEALMDATGESDPDFYEAKALLA